MITVEGSQLMAQATGQGKFAIFAETETKFFAKAVDIEIEFMKDESGKVTQLTLKQGPVPPRTAKRK